MSLAIPAGTTKEKQMGFVFFIMFVTVINEAGGTPIF